ncbi:MAG TPA: DinB family protein [Chitinophagaceae bacterium]|nr:DinB family protein [Chitinophagaceae bacterium]
MKKTFCLISACFLLIQSNAQLFSLADVRAQMVKDWQRAKDYTLEYLNTMPTDKYSYQPNDSVRTFAGHMLHLATFNVYYMIVANDMQPPSWLSREMQNRSSAQNKDSVMYYVIASYDFAINAVQNSDTSKWGEIKNYNPKSSATRFALMNKAFEHQEHHRSQTTIYIRMLGIRPPNERLF